MLLIVANKFCKKTSLISLDVLFYQKLKINIGLLKTQRLRMLISKWFGPNVLAQQGKHLIFVRNTVQYRVFLRMMMGDAGGWKFLFRTGGEKMRRKTNSNKLAYNIWKSTLTFEKIQTLRKTKQNVQLK